MDSNEFLRKWRRYRLRNDYVLDPDWDSEFPILRLNPLANACKRIYRGSLKSRQRREERAWRAASNGTKPLEPPPRLRKTLLTERESHGFPAPSYDPAPSVNTIFNGPVSIDIDTLPAICKIEQLAVRE